MDNEKFEKVINCIKIFENFQPNVRLVYSATYFEDMDGIYFDDEELRRDMINCFLADVDDKINDLTRLGKQIVSILR